MPLLMMQKYARCRAWCFVLPSALWFSSCATDNIATIKPSLETGAGTPNLSKSEAVASEEEINAVIASVDDKVEEDDEGSETQGAVIEGEISHATSQTIPLELNDEVQRWITYFSGKDRERFQRFMERGERFRPQITTILRDQGIPPEIYYQAMIESGFSSAATSSASAVGVWQFMRETGRRYGLRVDAYVDERRDPMRSTIAASLYLKDLYNVFQSWYLAMAAYNAGENRILSSIMRAKSRDFWAIARARALPEETLNYVPKFLAATTIGHDPQRFGFSDLKFEALPQMVSVPVPSPVRLTDIAAVAGIPLAALRDYNPHLIRGITPPGMRTYRIWVPIEQAHSLEAKADTLAALRVKGVPTLAALDAGKIRPQYHTVARGETLAKVAALYGLSMRQLKRSNHLRSNRLTRGTRLLLEASQDDKSQVLALKQYKVRDGDSLRSIARHFGVSIGSLKRMNGLRRNSVASGQVLKVEDRRG